MLTQLTVKWPPSTPVRDRVQTFTGRIVSSWPADPPGTIRLRTGDSYFPEKVIPKRLIVESEGFDLKEPFEEAFVVPHYLKE